MSFMFEKKVIPSNKILLENHLKLYRRSIFISNSSFDGLKSFFFAFLRNILDDSIYSNNSSSDKALNEWHEHQKMDAKI